MAGLNGKITDLFLQGLRRAHAGVALKAVLTPTSSAWTPRALYAELQREPRSDGRGQDRPSRRTERGEKNDG